MDKALQEKVNEELLRRDLADIRALTENDPFNRYYMRRLKDKIDLLEKSFHDDPPSMCDAQEREIQRRLLRAYKEMRDLCKAEAAVISTQLQRLSAEASRPT